MSDPSLDQFAAPEPKPDPVTFTFAPGGTVGEASFPVADGEMAQDALTRWAQEVLELPEGAMQLLDVTEVRAWGPKGGRGQYVKARVKKLDVAEQIAAEAAKRWKAARRPRAINAKPQSGSPGAVWWPITDTQLGKSGEWLGDTPTTLARLDWVAHEALPSWTRSQPIAPDTIVIPLLGDLTEGVSCSYSQQTYRVSHNAAEQLELAIEAVDRVVTQASKLSSSILLTGVASNHDAQSRRGGKENITDDWDDRTFVLLRTLARVYASARPQVKVQLPTDPNVAVVNDGYLTVASIHGHKPKRRPSLTDTMWEWWNGQVSHRRDAGAAQVLLTGHYHTAADYGSISGRYLCCLPSLDNGSGFYSDLYGEWSMPGVRPFATTSDGVVSGRAAMLIWEKDKEAARQQTGTSIA